MMIYKHVMILMLIALNTEKVLSTDEIEQERTKSDEVRTSWWKPKCTKEGKWCTSFWDKCCDGFTCEQNVCAREGDSTPTPAPTPTPEPVCREEGKWCTPWWNSRSCCDSFECTKDGWYHKCTAVTTASPSTSPAPTTEVRITASPTMEPEKNPICKSEGHLCLPIFNLFPCCDEFECMKQGWFYKCLPVTTQAPSTSPAPTAELSATPTEQPTLWLFNSTSAPSESCGVMPDECGEENKCCSGYKCIPVWRKKFCIKVLSRPIIPDVNPVCIEEKAKCLPLSTIPLEEGQSYLNCCEGMVCKKTTDEQLPLNHECVKGSARKRRTRPPKQSSCSKNKQRCGTKVKGGLDCCEGFTCCNGRKCDGVSRGRCKVITRLDNKLTCIAETKKCGTKFRQTAKCCDGFECCNGSRCKDNIFKGTCTQKA